MSNLISLHHESSRSRFGSAIQVLPSDMENTLSHILLLLLQFFFFYIVLVKKCIFYLEVSGENRFIFLMNVMHFLRKEKYKQRRMFYKYLISVTLQLSMNMVSFNNMKNPRSIWRYQRGEQLSADMWENRNCEAF